MFRQILTELTTRETLAIRVAHTPSLVTTQKRHKAFLLAIQAAVHMQ